MVPRADILVVDDRADIRYTIATVLRRNGFGVVLAADGASAIKRAANQQVGLFLLDVDLPDMNGFELCRRLKNLPALAGIPVVMCSANCADEDLQAAANAGAVAYISKPFDMVKLVDCIHRVWNQATDPLLEGLSMTDFSSLPLHPLNPAQTSPNRA
jgi:CheY-like chemotaxis protein